MNAIHTHKMMVGVLVAWNVSLITFYFIGKTFQGYVNNHI